jgi:hypothetical protein
MAGVLVPIGFFAMIVAIVVGPSFIRNYYAERDRRQMHETLRIAFEKGQPVPPELITALQQNIAPRRLSTPENDLRRAVVLIATGLGLCGLGYGLWYGLMSVSPEAAYISGGCTAGAGAIPGFIGLAHLILWFGRRRQATMV